MPAEEQLATALSLIEELQAENRALRDRVAHLEAQLRKNSQNSSLPPSSDPIGPRQSRAERRAAAKSDRRQGKQPGAPGASLARREPDVVVQRVPICCRCCGGDLADAEVVGEVRRQVIDFPPIRPVVTEHVAERRRCVCGTETVADFPPEARAPVCWGPEVRAFALYLLDRQHLPVERTAELLRDVLGAAVSTGWLCALQLEAAGKLPFFLSTLKERLGAEPVLNADETGTRVRTTKHWVHTVTTGLLTLVAVDPKRGAQALEAIGVLPHFEGTIVHDGWAPYELMEAAAHAQCGAHLLRHLAEVGEGGPLFEIWSKQMTAILLDAKAASEKAAEAGRQKVGAKQAADLRRRYHDTLDVAFVLVPPGPPPSRSQRGGWTTEQRKAWNLASRMRRDADQVLRLLDDTRVPFDNNAAERALRMVKLHDKISGSFHSLAGAQAFAAVRSYLQTAAAHGENLLDVLHQLFTTGPWIPPETAGGT